MISSKQFKRDFLRAMRNSGVQDLDRYTFDSVMQEMYHYCVHFNGGAEKRVALPHGKDYVVKFAPRIIMQEEIKIYRAAVREGLGDCFPYTSNFINLSSSRHYNIVYLQENVVAQGGIVGEEWDGDMDCDLLECARTFSCGDCGQCDSSEYHSYCGDDDVWCEGPLGPYLVMYYFGKEYFYKLNQFFIDHNINDMHNGNFFVMPDGRPVFTDFAGI